MDANFDNLRDMPNTGGGRDPHARNVTGSMRRARSHRPLMKNAEPSSVGQPTRPHPRPLRKNPDLGLRPLRKNPEPSSSQQPSHSEVRSDDRPILNVGEREARSKSREDNVRHMRSLNDNSPSPEQSPEEEEAAPKRRKGKNPRRVPRSNSLQGPCPGGPVDLSVLSSYQTHLMYTVSVDPSTDRGTLGHYSQAKRVRTMLLSDWHVQPQTELYQMISSSTLMQLTYCTYENFDMPLLSAFIDRWQPDTNTFHLPFGEMSILLHDVQWIMGLRIDGRPVRTDEIDADELHAFLGLDDSFDVCCDTYKLDDDTDFGPILDKDDILPLALMDMSTNENPADQCAAYLALLTGFTLFTGKRRNRIPARHMKAFFDPEALEEYSWGSATLAFLYRELGKATRSKTRGISGCLTLLQAWIYLHFPIFRPAGHTQGVTEGVPHSMMFKNRIVHDTKDDRYRANRMRIDSLTTSFVSWRPYSTRATTPPFISRFSGVISFMDIEEAYHPERCLRQFGYVQTIPVWPIHIPVHAFRGISHQGYSVEHGSAVQLWNMRDSHLLNLDSISTPWDLTNDPDIVRGYYEWYYRISHPRFYYDQIPDNVDSFDLVGYAQMADELKDKVMNIYGQPTDDEKCQMLLDHEENVTNLTNRMHAARLTSRGYVMRRD